MADKKKKQQEAAENAAEPAVEAAETAAPAADPRIAELEEANKALTEQLAAANKLAAETKDTLLRTAAEYDNYRKRTAREKDGIYADSVAATINNFLPVVDNLERAVAFSDTDGLKQGLELTLKQLADVLAKLKITAIDPTGKEFDPNLHNAVMHVEDESLGENTVAEVLQKGYMIGDRVIRHAMVKVAN